MKPVDEKVARLSTEGLELILGGRTYGAEEGDHAGRFRMDLPPKLKKLATDLLESSRIQALSSAASYEMIYTAYGHDLPMLQRCRAGLTACIDAAIRSRAAASDEDAQAFLEKLATELKPFEHEPTLSLGSEALRLTPAALVPQLQLQLQTDVDSIVRGAALWLDALAERECISLVEWFNPSAARYHFFRMGEVRDDLGSSATKAGNHFEGFTTTTEQKTRITVFDERRTHTVVNTRMHDLSEYRGPVPERIARFIDRIPRELRRYASVIEGSVTREEIVRKDNLSSRVDVQTHSVFEPDPAVVLFDAWALTGWGGSSGEPSGSSYQGSPASRADVALIVLFIITGLASVLVMSVAGGRAAILVAIFGGIMTLMNQIGMRAKK